MRKFKTLLLVNASQWMGYMDKGHRMANNYSLSQRTRTWAINYILSSCSSKITHKKLCPAMTKNMLEMNARVILIHPKRKTKPTSQSNDMP
jgi:hypothetical protein